MAEEHPRRLWVYWKQPKVTPDPSCLILTFLSPSAEQRLKLQHPGEVLFGREASLTVRKQARDAYLGVAARLAAVPAVKGKTLRQLLASPGQSSLWWYHRVSAKDCEADPTFDRIIALFTIAKVAGDRGIREIVLVGAPAEFPATLRQKFRVRSLSRRSGGVALACVRALASRVAFGLKTGYQCWLARKYQPTGKFDIVFSGFWNWSFRIDPATGAIFDRYFAELPKTLESASHLSVGWFAWMDNRQLPEPQRSIVILQSELNFRDLLRSLFNFKPLLSLVRLWKHAQFRHAFAVERFNVFTFFREGLVAGVLDSGIPYGELVAVGTERACRRVEPSVTFSFLEHFPYARAHYEGVRRGGLGTVNYTVQHASYCSEKTFLFLDPEIEFSGHPDGCAVPHPHFVLAMGTFAQELFLECGYEPGQVIVTGSPCYDRIMNGDLMDKSAHSVKKEVSLLLVGGMAVYPDLEMIDAACEVAKSMPELSVSFRKHPLSRIKQDRVQVTKGSLDEDVRSADIILFTYSTVAEEAFITGCPVWQWLPQGFNASALSEVVSIPRFGSVESLYDAILSYRSDPSKYIPDEAARRGVLSRLFNRADRQAASRIAGLVSGTLKSK